MYGSMYIKQSISLFTVRFQLFRIPSFYFKFFSTYHVFKNQEEGNQAIFIKRKKQNVTLHFSQTRIVTQEAKCSCCISVPSVGRKTVDKQTMLLREFELMVSRTQTKTEVKY